MHIARHHSTNGVPAVAETAIDRIRQLDKQRNQIIQAEKGRALEQANRAIAALNSMGFSYHLVDGAHRPAKRNAIRRKANGKGRVRDAACPICNFRTAAPHDARKHRGQGKRKRPFTPNELADLGLKKAG